MMPTNSPSRNVTTEAKRRREDSPVVAVAAAAAPLEENQPKKKPRRPRRSWDEYFDVLVKYKEQHDDCKVPDRYKEDRALGKWAQNQRSNRYCPKKLTLEQKDRLTQLGFDWETRTEKEEHTWNEFFESLKAYRKKCGDCCVPQGFKENRSLANWVNTQRKRYKRGTLPAHRKEKLESVEFTWSR
jgi:hypothetical protein